MNDYLRVLTEASHVIYKIFSTNVSVSIDKRDSQPFLHPYQIPFDGRVVLSFLPLIENGEKIAHHYTAGINTPRGFMPIIFFARNSIDSLPQSLRPFFTLERIKNTSLHWQILSFTNNEKQYDFFKF